MLDHLVVGDSPCALAYAWRRLREGRRVLVAGGATSPPLSRALEAFDAFVAGAAPRLDALLSALEGDVAFAVPPRPVAPLAAWTRAGLRRRPTSALDGALRRPGLLLERLRAGAVPPPAPPRLLAGGTSALTAALASRLGRALSSDARVVALEPRPAFAARCRAGFADGSVVEAHEVALDRPAFEQARLLAPHAPDRADVLAAVRYEPLVRIAVRTPTPLPPVAGFARVPGTRGRILDALFVTNLDGETWTAGGALVTARLGGQDDPGALELGDDLLRRTVEADLSRALGRRLEARLVAVSRDERARVRPAPGHRRRVARLASALGGRGVRLLGASALGAGLDRLVSAGVPVPGELPGGVGIA